MANRISQQQLSISEKASQLPTSRTNGRRPRQASQPVPLNSAGRGRVRTTRAALHRLRRCCALLLVKAEMRCSTARRRGGRGHTCNSAKQLSSAHQQASRQRGQQPGKQARGAPSTLSNFPPYPALHATASPAPHTASRPARSTSTRQSLTSTRSGRPPPTPGCRASASGSAAAPPLPPPAAAPAPPGAS